MEALEYDIEFPRGNTCPVSFNLTDDNGEPLNPSPTTEIYFTLKDVYTKTPYVLQKRLSTGGISLVDGVCSFTLDHNDTSTLKYKTNYDYSIDIKDVNLFRTLVIGKLTLTENSTHLANE